MFCLYCQLILFNSHYIQSHDWLTTFMVVIQFFKKFYDNFFFQSNQASTWPVGGRIQADGDGGVTQLQQASTGKIYFSIILNIVKSLQPVWERNHDLNGLVQERCNSSALAMELRLSCTNPLICEHYLDHWWLDSPGAETRILGQYNSSWCPDYISRALIQYKYDFLPV